MRKTIRQGALLGSTILTGALLLAAPAWAQPADDAADDGDTIVVTGSRIARDQFSSAAPIQSLDVDNARQLGVTSITELLQRSTVSNGQQLDTTLNTSSGNSNAAEEPALGGVGSSNIGLRGLGPERTLVLVNGKRLGSAGARGAPAQPDINLLPLSMVGRVEVLTEGASAIYGADAAAGVVNVILRDDFEGLELTTAVEVPEASGGLTKQFSLIAGAQGDRTRIVFGAEYSAQDRVLLGERVDCTLSMVEVAATGERLQECSNGLFDNVIGLTGSDVVPSGDIFVFYQPGVSAMDSDLGVENFTSALQLPLQTEFDGACERADQRCRFPFIPFYSGEDEQLGSDLVQPVQRFSTVALGGFDFDAFGGEHELFFESYYFNRRTDNKAPGVQVFPTVPGLIPQEDANGNIIVDGTGAPVLVDNPLNPFIGNANPILSLGIFPQDRKAELSQFRFVGGLRGDLMPESNWTYETFFSYDRGVGFVSEALMNETNLNLALNTLRLNSDGDPICGVPTGPNDFGFLTGQQCVPINFFADSVYLGGPNGEGAFETDAENRYLFGQRTNRTAVEQILVGGYITGDLFDIAGGGTVSTAFGGEWRRDTINSATDFLSSAGDNAGENPLTEEPTNGARDIWDLYGEVVVPLLQGHQLAEDLTVEGAIRYTNEENFGDEITYRGRLSYSPNDWMTLSGSYGTSFRAPNLRDAFLAPQQAGTSSRNDPCSIPAAAAVGGVYVPGNDTRSQTVRDNCALQGADITQLGLTASVTVPVTLGGNALTLQPETSRAYTATLLMSPPVSDNFDVDLSVSFFDIKIEDNIRSLAPEVIMSRCFDSVGLSDPLCSRLQRGNNPNAAFNFITFIDASFVNVGQERSQGIDLNTRLSTTFDGFGDGGLDATWTNAVTFQTKRTEVIFADSPTDNLLGDYGVPKTRIQSNFAFAWGAWQANFETRWIQGTGPSQDALSNVDFQCPGPNGVPATSTAYPGSPSVFLICDAGARVYQDVSLTRTLNGNIRATAGINNVFDKQPPLISTALGSNRGNRVTSSGYDQIGRSFFFTLTGAF